MAATVKHLKQFEKIFLGIRDSADEKLAHLKQQKELRGEVLARLESEVGVVGGEASAAGGEGCAPVCEAGSNAAAANAAARRIGFIARGLVVQRVSAATSR